MPACGQAVGCGVCDTPELWRGAAGLCARVGACAGAAEFVHTHIQHPSIVSTTIYQERGPSRGLGLAFTTYCFTSMLLCTNQSSFYHPLLPAWPALLQYYCTSIVQYTTPPPTPKLYAIHPAILAMAISCKGQALASLTTETKKQSPNTGAGANYTLHK